MSRPHAFVEYTNWKYPPRPYKQPRRWPKALAWVAIVTVMAAFGYLAVSDALARGMAPHFECPLGC